MWLIKVSLGAIRSGRWQLKMYQIDEPNFYVWMDFASLNALRERRAWYLSHGYR